MNPGLLTIAQPHHYESEEQPFLANAIFTFQLPLPQVPHEFMGVIVCRTANVGWVPGDIIPMTSVYNAGGGLGFSCTLRPGTVIIASETGWRVRSVSSPTINQSLTETSWALKVVCTFPPLT